MAKFHFQFPQTILSFSLLTFFFQFVSSQYTLPEQYFINCGSEFTVTDTGRNFIGDINPSTFSLSGDHNHEQYTNPLPNTPPLYQNATIFTGKSQYELKIQKTGTHMVRLHFYPFASPKNFFTSNFNVSVSGFSLLSNFSVQKSTNLPIIKEFLLPVQVGKFRIYFTPAKGASFAFVNAIEAFLTPDIFKLNASYVTLAGVSNRDYNDSVSHALNTIHRINVGGRVLTAENDTLRRNWVPDDDYIYFNNTAISSVLGTPSYQDGEATRFDAPYLVYSTARKMDIGPNKPSNDSNITWSFEVSRKSLHFARAHFCYIVNTGLDPHSGFNFYIYRQYSWLISSVDQGLQVPFYVDFVVYSDDSSNMSISIGSRSGSNGTAFLNGLEIMELVKGSNESEPGKSKNTMFIIIGCVVGGVGFVLILVVGFLFRSKYRKEKKVDWPIPASYGDSSTNIIIDRTTHNASLTSNLNLGLKVPLADIVLATKNFNPKLMIGQGGFGNVYKGVLPNGMKVAVKRSEPGHGQGLPEFQTEIMVLSRIRHRHLVSLIGYCDEGSEMILVYEFMEKGTLKDHLYNSNEESEGVRPKLSWNQRLEICIGAAQGLHYLHTGSGGIIHRDVKSTNILLNENYMAKVADFGISRLSPLDQSDTQISTQIKGSFGYLDPEYFRCFKMSQKSDVYSFGVVLLEVLCARPAINNMLPQSEVNLADWGISSMKKGELAKIVDPFLVGNINPNSLRKFGEIVEKCLNEYGDERPSMIDVLWDLEYALKIQKMTVAIEPHEDSTMNSSLNLPLPIIKRLPSVDDSEVNIEFNDSSDSSYPNASQVFSQLKMDDAR